MLLYILDEIRNTKRRDMSKQERFQLKGEDMREDFELSSYVARSLVNELCRSLDQNSASAKAAEARENATVVPTQQSSNHSGQGPRRL